MKNRKISFASFCRDILDEPISPAWNVVYRAFDGERLTPAEMETWHELTGRDEYEPRDSHELVAVKGRRAQGTKTATKYLAYKIHAGDFRRHAPKGDRLHVPIIAQSRDTAREVKSYLDTFYRRPNFEAKSPNFFARQSS